MEEHNATFDWPSPAMRARAMAMPFRVELLRTAVIKARAILADVNGGAVDADRAETITRIGNAYQILDMALEDDEKLDAGGTPQMAISTPSGITFIERDWSKIKGDQPPWKIHDERYGRVIKVKMDASWKPDLSDLEKQLGLSDQSDEAEQKRREAYVECLDESPIGTPDQIPAERPDPYRWADRLADEAGVVGGQGRSGGAMVGLAIAMIAGAALIAGVIIAAWVMSCAN